MTNIATKDNLTFDLASHSWGVNQFAVSHNPATANTSGHKKTKKKSNSVFFEKAGTIFGSYGFSFGEHLWEFKIQYNPIEETTAQGGSPSPLHKMQQQQADLTGIMVVGVMNKRFSTNKLIGSVVNYSLTRGLIKVRVFLDANKKRLTIFSPSSL